MKPPTTKTRPAPACCILQRLALLLLTARALVACADGSDPGFAGEPNPGLGIAAQPLVGTVDGSRFVFVSGLAPRDRSQVGIYQEPQREAFTPSVSYIDLGVAGPGEFLIGADASASFIICPPASSRCTRNTPGVDIRAATAGAIRLVEGPDPETLSGGARLEDAQGDSVDGTFAGVLSYPPLCARGSFQCDAGQVYRCTWDERGRQPVDACSEAACELVLADCR